MVTYIRFAWNNSFVREFNDSVGLDFDEKGSLESETVKYGRESQGTRTPE
jgi:hypothetical protein